MIRRSAILAVALASGIGALLVRRQSFFARPPATIEQVQTSKGAVDLPIRYYNGSLIGAFWLVEPSKAAALLPASLEPLVVPGLGTPAGLFLFEYRNTTIGSYGELGLTVQAVRAGVGAGTSLSSLFCYLLDMVANVLHFNEALSLFGEHETSGLYVVTLPVTTEGAMAAGREIWGYNKYLAKTTSDFTDPSAASFALAGELELKLTQVARSDRATGARRPANLHQRDVLCNIGCTRAALLALRWHRASRSRRPDCPSSPSRSAAAASCAPGCSWATARDGEAPSS